MRSSLMIKLTLDGIMILLFVLLLGLHITGDKWHEWLGVFLCFLFGAHGFLNARWFKSLPKGKYPFYRVFRTLINGTLIALMSMVCLSGLIMSHHVFHLPNLIDGQWLRNIHSIAAYWGLVLIGVHIGLHGEMLWNLLRKRSPVRFPSVFFKAITLLTAGMVVGGGIWASFDRQMGAKLFLGFSFDYWDPQKPGALFFLYYLAIVGFYAFLTNCLMKHLSSSHS